MNEKLHKVNTSAQIECKKQSDQIQSALAQKCLMSIEQLKDQMESSHGNKIAQAESTGKTLTI